MEEDFGAGIIIGLLIGAIVSAGIAVGINNSYWKNDAVANGVAKYYIGSDGETKWKWLPVEGE